MKGYYVYILKCSDEFLYTGMTNNMERRLKEHNEGLNKNCFTFKRRPLQLMFHQKFEDVNEAIYFEKKIKKWSRQKKMSLINGDYNMLEILSECRNATHYKYKTLKN
ncbi:MULTISPECIES: GIY-YIG nuclease family protein [unclassified Tenacibaculum]|uniref:GIY-YIG nuclease family protein n=1 Tax=unclassified Tenacibaculum TaxID=2635139 RepID=UPI001F32910A|nr:MULTISPECIES: GIY-YIG nuclease family protein [unclassified Tenacibaculum]MCF2876220.1 GIY-YIG nuclease family protein [Tenacibaculum sp. Cn5-1]MCF2936295.1 GIY-YIG nuclease family protein [Tenacibaculum sp. Cn5-34]MCG7511638.1 GIY-YIG nuclease family protein [Tenacibaculum sp. Cn5-46]